MSNLHQPQGNPVQEQGALQQQQQQTSPDATPQSDDEALDTAADDETLLGEGLAEVDGDDQTDQLRQSQANQQSDAEPEEGDIFRGAPKNDTEQADSASR